MGRSPCCSKEGLRRGAWTAKEDMILSEYIRTHGDGGWRDLPKKAGIKRCGKSCRLRWRNYLRPDIKRGSITPDEEELITRMHRLLGNRWSLIAGRLPGRTDNEIKNYWNTHLSMKRPSMNESQPNPSTRNAKTSSKSPALLQNHVFKTCPVRVTTAVVQAETVRPNGCSNRTSEEAPKLCNVQETTNSSKSQCDLLANDSVAEGDNSERIPSGMADVNLVETEIKSSTCSMTSVKQSPHSEKDAATSTESLLYLNELSSPHWNLFLSQSDCSADFGLEEFYREPAITMAPEMNDFEDIFSDQCNMQLVNSFRVADHQGMEELHDNAQHRDWIAELNYLLK